MRCSSEHLVLIALSAGLCLTSLIANAKYPQNLSPISDGRCLTTFSSVTPLCQSGVSDLYSSLASAEETLQRKSSDLHGIQHSAAILAADSSASSFANRSKHRELHPEWRHGIHMDVDEEFDEHFAASPIPDPAEYLLMLCGLALLGFIATRRRSDEGFAAA